MIQVSLSFMPGDMYGVKERKFRACNSNRSGFKVLGDFHITQNAFKTWTKLMKCRRHEMLSGLRLQSR
jgi:hypothetical protein